MTDVLTSLLEKQHFEDIAKYISDITLSKVEELSVDVKI